jgi:hypothetical protein
MTWVRIDDAFADNPKVEELSDAAFRLYVTILCWCSRHNTDGRVTGTVARKRGTDKTLAELVDAGLWLRNGSDYEVHDYLAYNPSKAEVSARREAVRVRVQKHRGNDNRNAVTAPSQHGSGNAVTDAVHNDVTAPVTNTDETTAIVRARDLPARPGPEERRDLSPPSQNSADRPKPPDPMGDSLRGRRTQDHPDVIAVFDCWKRSHGAQGAKFRQPADVRADILFEAVKTHGAKACLRVLEVAKTDRKVLGQTDERGEEHRSIEYLFSPSTFDRLLRAAELQDKQSKKPNSDDVFDAMMAANPEP